MGNVVRTETTVKEIDEAGVVVRETTTIVQVEQPPTSNDRPGLYL